MLKTFRDNFKHLQWILWAVILSFLISFVIIFQGGVGGLKPSGPDAPGKVGSRVITREELVSEVARLTGAPKLAALSAKSLLDEAASIHACIFWSRPPGLAPPRLR